MKTSTVWFVLGALALLAAPLGAQQRDPTLAPLVADVSAATGGEAATLGDLGLVVLVRGGKPYLASQTRVYAVGQTVGGYKIERISETEIWLRKGKELQKISRFNGIVRRAAAPERPTP